MKHTTTLQDEIRSRIEKDKIQQKSVLYFAALLTALSVLTFVLVTLAVYISNLLLVLQNAHEYLRVLDHGIAGYKLLLPSLPWALLVALVISFVVLIVCASRYFALYRFSISKIVVLGILLISISGYTLTRFDTSLVFLRLFGIESKPLKAFHNHYLDGHQGNIVHGTVTEVSGGMLTIELNTSKKAIVIYTTSNTSGILVDQSLVSQKVFMLIKNTSKGIEALYIGMPK
jgi:hypothetical protein